MKTLYFILTLNILSSSYLLGKIRNGYEQELQSCKLSLQKIKLLLADDHGISLAQKVKMKSKIGDLITYISCYELTQALLEQFRIISPELYQEIDSLRDKRGRTTDVYVRVVTSGHAKAPLRAASFFNYFSSDEDACYSRYGANSISIDIRIDDNALFLLSHELGHVRYIIPNVAAYTKFYNKQYGSKKVELTYIGHSHRDESGKYANAFEKKFLKNKQFHFENGGKKPESMFTLFNQLRKKSRNMESSNPRSVIASSATF
jgi:hypothetical protein